MVYVVGPDGKAQSRKVATGAEQGDLVQVLSGVQSGERVIRQGQYEIADGTKVKEVGKGAGPAGGAGEP